MFNWSFRFRGLAGGQEGLSQTATLLSSTATQWFPLFTAHRLGIPLDLILALLALWLIPRLRAVDALSRTVARSRAHRLMVTVVTALLLLWNISCGDQSPVSRLWQFGTARWPDATIH